MNEQIHEEDQRDPMTVLSRLALIVIMAASCLVSVFLFRFLWDYREFVFPLLVAAMLTKGAFEMRTYFSPAKNNGKD